MHYSQSPPLVEKDWLTVEETSYGGPARDLDARSDQRIGMRPMKSLIQQVASDRPTMGRRIFRTLTWFFIAILIGIGSTLAWQSHGDAAREMVVARAPMLAWLLYVSTTKSSAVVATSPDPVQQLEPLASSLNVVRRSVEQLAAKQEQMAQNIASLQAVEEDIRQKMSFSSPSQQAAPIPLHKPPQRAQSSAVQSPLVPRTPPPAGPPVISR